MHFHFIQREHRVRLCAIILGLNNGIALWSDGIRRGGFCNSASNSTSQVNQDEVVGYIAIQGGSATLQSTTGGAMEGWVETGIALLVKKNGTRYCMILYLYSNNNHNVFSIYDVTVHKTWTIDTTQESRSRYLGAFSNTRFYSLNHSNWTVGSKLKSVLCQH